MGYSSRYHAASLVAVFIALAVGILIGSEFGGEVVTSTRESLERSLAENLEDSQEEVDELASRLERSQDFGERAFPALAGDRLRDRRIGLVAIGSLEPAMTEWVEDALEPTGAALTAVGVVRVPPAIEELGDEMAGTRFADIAEEPQRLEALGERLGAELDNGGRLLERLRGDMFSRISGGFRDIDGLIVVRAEPEDLEPEQARMTDRLREGLLNGMAGSDATVVGAEGTNAEPSSIALFESHNIASVDNVDEIAGRLSLVLALVGAQGNFGAKSTADSFLPDLIPAPGTGSVSGASAGSGAGARSGAGGGDPAGR